MSRLFGGGVTPGMPEHGNHEDRMRRLESTVQKLITHAPGALSGDGTTTFLRSGNFEVTGGSIKVQEGGAFEIIAEDGQKLADFDKDAVTFYDTNEDPLSVLDRSGQVFFGSSGTKQVDLTTSGLRVFDSSGTQRASFSGGGVTLWDENGDLVWSSSLAWSIEVPPSTTARATSSSTTYQEVCRFYLPISTEGTQESGLERLRLSVDTDSSPTEPDVGEIRVTAQTFEVSAFGGGSSHILGTATFQDDRISGGAGTEIPRAFTFDGLNDDDVELVVEVRRQSGSGTVGAQVRRPLRIS